MIPLFLSIQERALVSLRACNMRASQHLVGAPEEEVETCFIKNISILRAPHPQPLRSFSPIRIPMRVGVNNQEEG